jgi:hypothetical protein
LLQLLLAQLSKTGLGARFEQTKLGFGQLHLLADLFLGFFIQIKAGEHLAITLGEFLKDTTHEVHFLVERGALFRIIAAVRHPDANVQMQLLTTAVYDVIDMRGDLPPNYSAHEAHETFGFPQIPASNGLHHDQESIVNLIVEFLRSELPA